ncbi:MAG: hypothetical protein PHH40_02325 [Candidatus Moranbacteria bacterium]|nr:hypothetical protein [Candidatus Moranbacteria bacterium]MDD3965391.1 hypothetical protein [Candidatus Moranbacteria bacterium]
MSEQIQIQKKQRLTRGFLLPEVILALFVLSMGILTVVSLIANSLRESIESRNIITATLLAQEGAELIRNVRDNGFVQDQTDVFAHFSKDNTEPHYYIDYDDQYNDNLNHDTTINPETKYSLQTNNDGFFLHNANGKFYRYIYINFTDSTVGSESADVTSFVYWGYNQTGMFQAANGNNGNITDCTMLKKCVYTKITLNNWRP